MNNQYSEEALELHRAMLDIGSGDKDDDFICAMSLTLAYMIKYRSMTAPERVMKAITELVMLEIADPNSQMEKPNG